MGESKDPERIDVIKVGEREPYMDKLKGNIIKREREKALKNIKLAIMGGAIIFALIVTLMYIYTNLIKR